MSRSIDAAIRRLEAFLPAGAYIEEFHGSTSWGSRDPAGSYKPDLGPYRQRGPGWCVEVYTDGWEHERDHWFQWGTTIREACLKLAWSFRLVGRNPHLQHLGLEGPGEATFEGYFVRSCPSCVHDAETIFGGDVDWEG